MSNWKKSKRMSRNNKVCQHSFVFYITRLLLPHATENKTMLWVPLSSAKDFNSPVSALLSLCFYWTVSSPESKRQKPFFLLSVIDSVSVWVNVRAQVFVYTCYLSYVYNLLPSCQFKARIPNLGSKVKPGQSSSVASKQQPSQLRVITWEACQSRQTHTNMPLFKA